MPKSVMCNVRLKEEEVQRIDKVAEALGQNRSDFIRSAITEKLARSGGGDSPVTGVRVRGKAKPKSSKGCPTRPDCRVQKLLSGQKVCVSHKTPL